ncbi:ABC transporter ATP-binding protein [Paradesulfitobacterium ferrireducens]|uniref:ABC transporter ATP-binding protein n=1 Tax=Paradesulfitobacterium ferrireducens TaxID=2816476 RepID=UPI001A90A3E8|nr:ABC transporter ATP-binding protein [Paradesulfitobacterium ferrireducens]
MLEVQEIEAFYGEVQALHKVSIRIEEGEMVGLVGANGAGKSTMLKVISGMMKPASGMIKFEHRVISGLPSHKVVELGVAHVPEGRRLFPLMTVEENLEMGSYLPGPKQERKDTMDMVFSMLPKLKERRKQLAGTLSGGEQQMLAIGRGLMSKPKLLMLDETSLGLAPVLVEAILEIIEQIRKQKISIFMVEQNVTICLQIVDRAYVLENGKIVMEGKGTDLLENDHLKTAYLGL